MRRAIVSIALVLLFASQASALDSNSLIQNLFFDTNRCLIEGKSQLGFNDDFDSFNILLNYSNIDYRYVPSPESASSVSVKIRHDGQLISEKTTKFFSASPTPLQSLTRLSRSTGSVINEFDLISMKESEVFKREVEITTSNYVLRSDKGREIEFSINGNSIEAIKLKQGDVAITEIRKVFENSFGITFSISYFGSSQDDTYLYMLSIIDNDGQRTLTGHYLINFNPTMLSTEMIIVDNTFFRFGTSSGLTGRGPRILDLVSDADKKVFSVSSPPTSHYREESKYYITNLSK